MKIPGDDLDINGGLYWRHGACDISNRRLIKLVVSMEIGVMRRAWSISSLYGYIDQNENALLVLSVEKSTTLVNISVSPSSTQVMLNATRRVLSGTAGNVIRLGEPLVVEECNCGQSSPLDFSRAPRA